VSREHFGVPTALFPFADRSSLPGVSPSLVGLRTACPDPALQIDECRQASRRLGHGAAAISALRSSLRQQISPKNAAGGFHAVISLMTLHHVSH
jgi:hypothetical protein